MSINLGDVPGASVLVGSLGSVLDLALNSGQFVGLALLHLDQLLPAAAILNRLAKRVPWLDVQLTEQLVTIVMVALATVYVARWLDKVVNE